MTTNETVPQARVVARDSATPATFVLVMRTAGQREQRFALRHGSVVVGSGEEADVRVADPEVSRRHLELTLVAEGVRARDLASRNGTYYLGSRIESSILADGARLMLGQTSVELMQETSARDVAVSESTQYGELRGESLAMRRVFGLLEVLEGSEAPILINAETGTGKELLARAIHTKSKRGGGPFVVFDCAAAQSELIESELFGHARGAFTGADKARAGLFEEATGGTLLIDEIGDLPAALQPRLLRALERSEVRRVGENHYRPVDVRIIAATHHDLESRADAGTFRSDLYYRLAVIVLTLPPLNARREDIPLLAQHFAKAAGHPEELAERVVNRLVVRDWPGNVRQLRNIVQRIVALGDAGLATNPSERKPRPRTRAGVSYKAAREELLDAFEEEYVRELMAKHEGSVTEAARGAELSRKHLHELIKKHGL